MHYMEELDVLLELSNYSEIVTSMPLNIITILSMALPGSAGPEILSYQVYNVR